MRPNGQALTRQTERLRLELLENLLQTTQTFIELTELEVIAENGPHSVEGIEHVQQGFRMIRKFMPAVSSPAKRARISKRLNELEQRAAKLTRDFEKQQG